VLDRLNVLFFNILDAISLVDGQQTQITLQYGGGSGLTDTFSTTVRKCGSDYHILYEPPPALGFSALALGKLCET